MNRYLTIGSMLLFFVVSMAGFANTHHVTTNTFTNPIMADGADPWVIRHNGNYYYCCAFLGNIFISQSENLHEIGTSEKKAVWSVKQANPMKLGHVWAPELHYLDEKWYVYFTAVDDKTSNIHQMFVLEGTSPDPLGDYRFKGKIASPSDKWAIDGTVLVMENNRKYFIWSGWEGDENVSQNIYFAPMSNPWTINGERVLISKPEYEWEKHGNPLVNEGPQMLRNDKGKIFIIYSASGSWTDYYCLGMLTLVGDNPMDSDAWEKSPKPVFAGTETVTSPGHASFTTSPDGKEHWIMYHAAKHKGAGWRRNIRMQPFTFDLDGNPCFGYPVTPGIRLKLPSGTKWGN